MSTTIASRKKRDTSSVRQKIMTGAIRVFVEKGYAAASMDKIAETAGVSKRTVYNHYPSKELLFKEVVTDFVRQRDEKKPITYALARPLRDQLIEFAKAELFLINDPQRRGLSKFLTSHFLMDNSCARELIGKNNPQEAFIRWLCAAKEDQRLDFETPQLPARIFYGMVEGCLTWAALFTDGENLADSDLVLDEIASAFLSRYGLRGATFEPNQIPSSEKSNFVG